MLKRKGIVPIAPRLPLTRGHDLGGVVDQLGDEVSSPDLGQKVAALPMIGSYAEPNFSGYVTLKGGEYFFAPSVDFLRNI